MEPLVANRPKTVLNRCNSRNASMMSSAHAPIHRQSPLCEESTAPKFGLYIGCASALADAQPEQFFRRWKEGEQA
jgi:hypothetical protein